MFNSTSTWRGFVWGLGGFLKLLVFEKKYLPAEGDRPAGWYECLRIEDPKAKS